MVLSDDERESIDYYGFTVTTNAWDEYVLIDPQLPKDKNRFRGKDLDMLIVEALQARKKLGTRARTPYPVVRTAVPMKHGKIYEIKKMIIEDETLTSAQVLDRLGQIGMPSTINVVSQVRTELLESLKLLRELNVLIC